VLQIRRLARSDEVKVLLPPSGELLERQPLRPLEEPHHLDHEKNPSLTKLHEQSRALNIIFLRAFLR
jgi:hypothetical protein